MHLCACSYLRVSLTPHRVNVGVDWGHRRDQDVRLDFPTLAKALVKVALGEVGNSEGGGGAAAVPPP